MSNAFNSSYPVVRLRRTGRNGARYARLSWPRRGPVYVRQSRYPLARRRGRMSSATFSELKFFDTQINAVTVVPAGQVLDVSAIPNGYLVQQRIGQYACVKSLFLRADVGLSTAAQDSVRIMMFYDTSNIGSLPAVTDVLTLASPLSPIQLNATDRFKVIFDEFFTLSNTGEQRHSIKRFKKMNLQMKFSGDSNKNHIYLLCVGDVASPNNSLLNFYCRIRFTDA